MLTKDYIGIDNRVVLVMLQDNSSYPLESSVIPSIDLTERFDWGYVGDKPINLAVSILSDYFKVTFDELPEDLVKAFLRDFVLVVEPDYHWTITSGIIYRWCEIIMMTEDDGKKRHSGIKGELEIYEKDKRFECAVRSNRYNHMV